MKKPKIAKHVIEPIVEKRPKSKDPEIEGHPLAWRFSGCDRDGPFSWLSIESTDKHKQIIDALHEFETKPWAEIKEQGSHPIPCHQLEKPARDRLKEIEFDDVEELMSFRIAGAHRVWCVQSGHIMRVLWWDPNHQVYFVPKDRGDRAKLNKRRRNR